MHRRLVYDGPRSRMDIGKDADMYFVGLSTANKIHVYNIQHPLLVYAAHVRVCYIICPSSSSGQPRNDYEIHVYRFYIFTIPRYNY